MNENFSYIEWALEIAPRNTYRQGLLLLRHEPGVVVSAGDADKIGGGIERDVCLVGEYRSTESSLSLLPLLHDLHTLLSIRRPYEESLPRTDE